MAHTTHSWAGFLASVDMAGVVEVVVVVGEQKDSDASKMGEGSRAGHN